MLVPDASLTGLNYEQIWKYNNAMNAAIWNVTFFFHFFFFIALAKIVGAEREMRARFYRPECQDRNASKRRAPWCTDRE